jgi:HAD superfamily hydrolase (TIGR01490 family)
MHLVLFDFDNTLTTCDTYSRFLRSLATPQQLAQAKWKIGPWLLAYRMGLISAHRIRKRVTQLAFAGQNAAEIAAHGASYAREILPATLHPEMMQRLEWHKSQGHEIVVVSGSLDVYLQPWCEQQGVALICNRLEAIDSQLTGRYAGGDVAPYKAREIRTRYDLPKYQRIYAYGDSREDKPMLALAHERWYAGKRSV